MSLTNTQKQQIQQTIANCLRIELHNFKAKDNFMPFHFRLLGKDRLALYSFMQSLLTTFGTSIFEPVFAALAKTNLKSPKVFGIFSAVGVLTMNYSIVLKTQTLNSAPKLTNILAGLINNKN
jgi:hypothetical protein